MWCHLLPNDSCQAVTMCRSAQIYPCDRQLGCDITRIVTERSGMPVRIRLFCFVFFSKKIKKKTEKCQIGELGKHNQMNFLELRGC